MTLHLQKEIDESMDTLRNVVEIYLRKRKAINNMTKVIWKPNYNLFTDGRETRFPNANTEIEKWA